MIFVAQPAPGAVRVRPITRKGPYARLWKSLSSTSAPVKSLHCPSSGEGGQAVPSRPTLHGVGWSVRLFVRPPSIEGQRPLVETAGGATCFDIGGIQHQHLFWRCT